MDKRWRNMKRKEKFFFLKKGDGRKEKKEIKKRKGIQTKKRKNR